MALQGCYGCLKYIVFVFNLIFWFLGIALLGFALWLRLDPRMNSFVDGGYGQSMEIYYSTCYVLMAAGGLMTLVGFLGCCGAYHESKRMLAVFFAFLILIFIMQLAAGVWAYVHRDQLKDSITSNMRKVIQQDYGAGKDVEKSVDYIQRELRCCGGEAPSDYVLSHWVKVDSTRNGRLPDSCCKEGTTPSTCSVGGAGVGGTSPTVFSEGCGERMIRAFQDHLLIVVAIALGIACLQIIGLMFSFVLLCRLRSKGSMSHERFSERSA